MIKKIINNKYFLGGLFILNLVIIILLLNANETYSLVVNENEGLCPTNWIYNEGNCYQYYNNDTDCQNDINKIVGINDDNNYCYSEESNYIGKISSEDYLKKTNGYVIVDANGGSFVSKDGKKLNEYKIKLKYHELSLNKDKVFYGGKILFDDYVLEKNNKVLAGFSKNSSCDTEIYGYGDYISTLNNSVLYACYNLNDVYSVNLISNGGNEFDYKTINANNNASVILPDVSRDNYVFMGWYDGNNNLVDSKNYNVNKSVTLYAKWSYNNNVVYKNSLNDLSNCAEDNYYYLNSENFCKNEKLKTIQSYLKKLNYYDGSINGSYNLDTMNSVIKFKADNHLGIDSVLDKNTIDNIKNMYERKKIDSNSDNYYSIVYNANKGSFYDDSTSIELFYRINSIPVGLQVTPKRDGYIFAGWYLNNKLYKFDSKLDKNIVLNARWLRNNKRSYLCNGDDYFDDVSNQCISVKNINNITYTYDSNGNVTFECSGMCNVSKFYNNSKNKLKLISNSSLDNNIVNVTGNTCSDSYVSCHMTITNLDYEMYTPTSIVTLLADDDDYYDEYVDDWDMNEDFSDEDVSSDEEYSDLDSFGDEEYSDLDSFGDESSYDEVYEDSDSIVNPKTGIFKSWIVILVLIESFIIVLLFKNKFVKFS